MTASRVRRIVCASAALAGLVFAGCLTSPATRFYVLTPVSPSDAELNAAEGSPVPDRLTIGVRSIELPDELDRPQIVTRTGPNTVRFAEFDRWSASLRDSVMQLVATNLGTLLPGAQLAVYPWPPGTSVDWHVIVEITRFDCETGGQCALHARWRAVGGLWPVDADGAVGRGLRRDRRRAEPPGRRAQRGDRASHSRHDTHGGDGVSPSTTLTGATVDDPHASQRRPW